jgi:indolepyruvate ferredoxin oxidoreductase
MRFGPWVLKAFGVLASIKGLRGTALDVFGYTHERRTERQLIRDYEALLEEILAKLNPRNHATAVGLADIPQKIRGFGHIKARNLEAAKKEEADLLARFRSGEAALPMAAE